MGLSSQCPGARLCEPQQCTNFNGRRPPIQGLKNYRMPKPRAPPWAGIGRPFGAGHTLNHLSCHIGTAVKPKYEMQKYYNTRNRHVDDVDELHKFHGSIYALSHPSRSGPKARNISACVDLSRRLVRPRPPIQGLKNYRMPKPRALPWAGIGRPFGAGRTLNHLSCHTGIVVKPKYEIQKYYNTRNRPIDVDYLLGVNQ
jgi:hypothetical protein